MKYPEAVADTEIKEWNFCLDGGVNFCLSAEEEERDDAATVDLRRRSVSSCFFPAGWGGASLKELPVGSSETPGGSTPPPPGSVDQQLPLCWELHPSV